MSQDGPIEGVSGRSDADGLSPGLRAWQDAMDRTDAEDALKTEALEEEARLGHVAAAPTVEIFDPRDAAGLIGAGATSVSPLQSDSRDLVMAARQAEALARLEIPAHLDSVNAAQRGADGTDAAVQVERHEEHDLKHALGELTNREQQKMPDALATPDDFVSGVAGSEHRSAQERLADRDGHASRVRIDLTAAEREIIDKLRSTGDGG
jgi:hypothetical protein